MKKTIFFLAIILMIPSQRAVAGEYGVVDIHGFISQGYMVSDKNDYYYANTEDGTFEFNEMGLNFGTRVNDSLRLGIQVFAKDLGEIGNDEITLDWASADWQYRNWLGVRVGKIKVPFGLYNQAHDLDMTRTQILLPQSAYPEIYREIMMTVTGMGLYGSLPGRIDYQAAYGSGSVEVDSGVVREIEDLFSDTGFPITINQVDLTIGPMASFLWNTPIDGFSLGVTYSGVELTFVVDQALGWIDLTGGYYIGSMEYVAENLRVSTEYMVKKLTMTLGTTSIEQDQDTEDYYVMGSYRFSEWFELGMYYSVSYQFKDDRDGKDFNELTHLPKEKVWMKDFALSTRFDINDYWLIKLEGHRMNGLRDTVYDPSDPDPDAYLFAAKVTYTF